MTFILDSLGKAEQTRQVSQSPELHQVFHQQAFSQTPPRRSLLSLVGGLVGGAAIVTAAFTLGVIYSPNVQTLYKQIQSKTSIVSVDPIQGYAKRIKIDVLPKTELLETSPLTRNSLSNSKTDLVDAPLAINSRSIDTQTLDQNEPVLTSKLTPSIADAVTLNGISISVISYSENPLQRFAMINGSIVKEGDVLAQGYTVTKINTDTVNVITGDQKVTLRLN